MSLPFDNLVTALTALIESINNSLDLLKQQNAVLQLLPHLSDSVQNSGCLKCPCLHGCSVVTQTEKTTTRNRATQTSCHEMEQNDMVIRPEETDYLSEDPRFIGSLQSSQKVLEANNVPTSVTAFCVEEVPSKPLLPSCAAVCLDTDLPTTKSGVKRETKYHDFKEMLKRFVRPLCTLFKKNTKIETRLKCTSTESGDSNKPIEKLEKAGTEYSKQGNSRDCTQSEEENEIRSETKPTQSREKENVEKGREIGKSHVIKGRHEGLKQDNTQIKSDEYWADQLKDEYILDDHVLYFCNMAGQGGVNSFPYVFLNRQTILSYLRCIHGLTGMPSEDIEQVQFVDHPYRETELAKVLFVSRFTRRFVYAHADLFRSKGIDVFASLPTKEFPNKENLDNGLSDTSEEEDGTECDTSEEEDGTESEELGLAEVGMEDCGFGF